MARVISKQTLTDSPSSFIAFLPAGAVASPWVYASVCFISGLLASTLLAVVLPVYAEEDDLRSFVSFGIGALLCCFLLKKAPVQKAQKVDEKGIYAEPSDVNKVSANCSAAPSSSRMHHPPASGPNAALSFAPPPGLHGRYFAPPGLEQHATPVKPAPTPWRAPIRTRMPVKAATPPLELVMALQKPLPPIPKTPLPYTPKTFRQEIIIIMKELASHKNVGKAVGQVRQQGVPVDRQSAEFADILTFAVEESRGNIRRTYIAFVGGLTGAFEKAECLVGLGHFFDTVYEDLCEEVVKLSRLIKIEVLPILNSVLTAEHVSVFVPEAILAAE